MSHDHAHEPRDYNTAFAVGLALNIIYVAIEAVAGLLINSLALLADAGHNLSDVLGLVLAWAAHYLSQTRPTVRRTYGLRSTTIWAALANALILLVAIGGIIWEAVRRIGQDYQPTGSTIVWVALAGVVVNAVTAWLFFAGRKQDLNIQGAFLHMAADAGVSVGVVIAGLAIQWTGRAWIDPLTSIIVAMIIFFSAWGLLKDSLNLALQGVPGDIDLEQVKQRLEQLPGVERVHDLHIWAISTTQVALTAHLVKPQVDNDDALLASACQTLHDEFGIAHATVQIERDPAAARCEQATQDGCGGPCFQAAHI